MRKHLLFAVVATAMAAGIFTWRCWRQVGSETFVEHPATPPEAGPLCPWRNPESDLKMFFPDATAYQTGTRILSGLRSELAAKLRRVPTGDENALRVYRVCDGNAMLGAVLCRRVKGEYGAIELVVATDANRSIRGIRLQRLREPASIAAALEDSSWQRAFVGKRAEDPWHIGGDLPDVPATARASADAVVQGTRDLLILLTAADQAQRSALAESHHH